jgi:hypothetical protein
MSKSNRINISIRKPRTMTDTTAVAEQSAIEETKLDAAVEEQASTESLTVTEVEVQEVPVVEEPVVLQKGSRVYSINVSTALADVLNKIETTHGPAAMVGLMQVFEYIEHMKPGRTISVAEGVRRQADLLRGLKNIIENSGNAFTIVFSALLKTIDENVGVQGAFNDKYLFRFFENVTMSPADQQAFRRLMNLFKETAPVNRRSDASKIISFTKSLQYGLTDAGKQRILTYYQV